MEEINASVQENQSISMDVEDQVVALNQAARELKKLVLNWHTPETLAVDRVEKG